MSASPMKFVTMTLVAEALDGAGFAGFGSVLAAGDAPGTPVNEGRGVRIDLATGLVHDTPASQPSFAVYRMQASHWPVPVRLMERHPHSAQMFVPMTGGDYLVVVAPADAHGGPDMASARAFVGRRGEGVIYAPGVWHLPMVALGEPADFAMLMWETGDPAADCEVLEFAAPMLVAGPDSGTP